MLMSFVDIKPIYLNKRHLFQNKINYLDKIYLCFLRILTGKKHPQIKLQRFRKL